MRPNDLRDGIVDCSQAQQAHYEPELGAEPTRNLVVRAPHAARVDDHVRPAAAVEHRVALGGRAGGERVGDVLELCQIADREKQASGMRGKLSNEGYVAKAPPAVVEETRKKLAEVEADIVAAKGALAALGG